MRVAWGVVLALAVAVTPQVSQATCWELGLRVKNSSGQFVSTPVSIYHSEGGALIWSGSSDAAAGSDGVNLRINLNSTCPLTVPLTPDVKYTFVFTGWSNKAFYYIGHLIPGQPVDDVYTVTPSAVTHYSGPLVQEIFGYPTAYWTPLSLTLAIIGETYVGSKTNYTLRGTASGGGPYTITWTNVGSSSPSNVNPSQATRTVLNGQSVTVTCTVTRSGSSPVMKSIVLTGGAATPVEAVSWSWIKALAR